MQTHHDPRVRLDGYSRFCLTALAVLLTVLILGLWAEDVRPARQAVAAERFLNTSAQREAGVEAQRECNAKLDEIIQILKSGELKVRIVEGAPPKAPGGGSVQKPKKK